MTPRGKFLEHIIGMGMLWIPAILIVAILVLARQPYEMAVFSVAAFGLLLILAAKWRLMRTKELDKFGYSRLRKAEKLFFLGGYLFVAIAFFVTVYINMI